jgi:hypothetical protein
MYAPCQSNICPLSCKVWLTRIDYYYYMPLVRVYWGLHKAQHTVVAAGRPARTLPIYKPSVL